MQLTNVIFSTKEMVEDSLATSLIYKPNMSQKFQGFYFFIMSMTFFVLVVLLSSYIP